MLVDLRLLPNYHGFTFLSDSRLSPATIPPHRHLELEVNLVVRGTITYVVGERRYTFPEKSVAWFFPDQIHQLVDRSKDSQYHVAVFKPRLVKKVCQGARYPSFNRTNHDQEEILLKVISPSSFQLLHEIAQSLQIGGPDLKILNREAGYGISPEFRYRHSDIERLNVGLHYLLRECRRVYESEKIEKATPKLHVAVQRALTLITEHPDLDSLDQIAANCGSSVSHLCRLFHQQVGVPINRYRNSCRLGAFIRIYQKFPHKTLMEAAYEAGFGSYPQFHKIFTDSFGISPRKYFR